jgi:hypothetical protein
MSNLELLRDYKLKNKDAKGIQITANGKIIEITPDMLKPYIEYINENYERLKLNGWTEEDTKEFLMTYKEFCVADLYILLKTRYTDIVIRDEHEAEKLKHLSVYTIEEFHNLRKRRVLL